MPRDSLSEAKALLRSVSPEVIGQRLRRARAKQGLSIRDLADRAGVSKTSVVRIEQGQPAFASTVVRICGALGLHLAGLADPSSVDAISASHLKSDDSWFDMTDFGSGPLAQAEPEDRQALSEKGLSVALLYLRNRLPGGMILPAILEVYSQSEPRSHPGEEMVYVLKGRLRIYVGSEVKVLEEGECITFWSAEEHYYAPADPGDVPVTVLSIRIDYVRSN